MVNVGVDNVAAKLAVVLPHMIKDLTSRQHLILMAKEQFEELKLFHRQVDFTAISNSAVTRNVQEQVAGSQLIPYMALLASSTKQRAQSRHELRIRKGLRKVIVGAGIQSAHAVPDVRSRGQHQDWSVDSRRPQAPTHLETVNFRQHHVEDDHIEATKACHVERLAAVGGNVGRVRLFPEHTPNRTR
jgi:hypothetical protein